MSRTSKKTAASTDPWTDTPKKIDQLAAAHLHDLVRFYSEVAHSGIERRLVSWSETVADFAASSGMSRPAAEAECSYWLGLAIGRRLGAAAGGVR